MFVSICIVFFGGFVEVCGLMDEGFEQVFLCKVWEEEGFVVKFCWYEV